jgi:hypothetical protein
LSLNAGIHSHHFGFFRLLPNDFLMPFTTRKSQAKC